MKKQRRPICRNGYRNALCPYYGLCLDEAVKKSWQYWDCRECEHRSSRESDWDVTTSVNDQFPYYDLPLDIYVKVC